MCKFQFVGKLPSHFVILSVAKRSRRIYARILTWQREDPSTSLGMTAFMGI